MDKQKYRVVQIKDYAGRSINAILHNSLTQINNAYKHVQNYLKWDIENGDKKTEYQVIEVQKGKSK